MLRGQEYSFDVGHLIKRQHETCRLESVDERFLERDLTAKLTGAPKARPG